MSAAVVCVTFHAVFSPPAAPSTTQTTPALTQRISTPTAHPLQSTAVYINQLHTRSLPDCPLQHSFAGADPACLFVSWSLLVSSKRANLLRLPNICHSKLINHLEAVKLCSTWVFCIERDNQNKPASCSAKQETTHHQHHRPGSFHSLSCQNRQRVLSLRSP